ncbi:MAG: VWA domain-containing protein [bacterium]|nr:VWA domain-containing protein [bacterium]
MEKFISSNAYKRLGLRSGREIDFFKTALITLALVFFITALAGPQWGKTFENLDVKGVELIFLLDTSVSMNAEDLKPNRLEIAKELIANIVDTLRTDFVSLINFAGVPYVQCPLTIDYDAFKLMTDASVISPGEEQGTDFERAFKLALKSFAKSKSDKKILFLITDGEDQEKTWKNMVDEIQEQKIIVFTIGVGISSGAPIPVRNDKGELTGYKKDKEGNTVKTRLDEDSLVQVASSTGGQYYRLTDSAAQDTIINGLEAFERNVISKKVRMKKIKRFHYPLIIGIFLLILELFLSEKRLQLTKNEG